MSEEKKTAEEGKSKKRELIKNIAIIFLAVMLILTFFSNTIMNYSLPEVSTDSLKRAEIRSQIRGKGTLEAKDPYEIIVEDTRVIASVCKKEGETVEKGDVIFYLEGEESKELTEAKAALEDLKTEYQKLILTSGVTAADVEEIESGAEIDISGAQSKMLGYKNSNIGLEKEIQSLESQIKQLTSAKDAVESGSTHDIDNEISVVQKNSNSANEKLQGMKETDPGYEEAKAEAERLARDVADLTTAKAIAERNITYENDLQKKELQNQIDELTRQKDEKTSKKALLETQQKDDDTRYTGKIDLAAKYKKMLAKQEEVDALEAKALGGKIEAPVAGTIKSISYVAGEKTEPSKVAAVINVEGKGFTTSFTVSNKQAKTVKVGAKGEVDSWGMENVNIVLSAIKNDTSKPADNKILVFDITGDDLVDGQQLEIKVGQKGSEYEYTVPNAAIKEGQNGKFVLTVVEKSTPFGNRYIAKKIEVNELDKDDYRTAVNGDFGEYGYRVITISSQPIEGGQQVRLAKTE